MHETPEQLNDTVEVLTLRDNSGDMQCVPADLENIILILKSCGYKVMGSFQQTRSNKRDHVSSEVSTHVPNPAATA